MTELLVFDEQVKVLASLVSKEGGTELFKQSLQEALDNITMAVTEGMDGNIIQERIVCLKNLLQRQEAWLLELRGRLTRGLEVAVEEWS